jgi:hypothetical protein
MDGLKSISIARYTNEEFMISLFYGEWSFIYLAEAPIQVPTIAPLSYLLAI